MCGIVGYVGKREALPILIDGLKNLEYRGYDSCGFALFDKLKVHLKKSVGRIYKLEEKISGKEEIKGNIGIAHTRWATHGGVTEKNAHPHFDCKNEIYLVHNGIIENFKELKSELLKKKHKFNSETDTEVLAHLIEEIKKENNVPVEEAVRLALKKVRGTYGLVVFDRSQPEKLVAARNFSPLILGVGNNEVIVASDPMAVLKITNHVLYLKNGELAVISGGIYRIFNIQNETIQRSAEKLDYDALKTGKGKYPHFMLKEIFEEPEAIKNSIRGRLIVEQGKTVLGGLKEIEDKLAGAKKLIICACGSAYLAGKVGEYILEEYAGIPTKVEFASEFRYKKPVFEKGDVFLAVSQSGETADTLASLSEAKEKGILTLGIVNAIGSTVSRETDAGVYQHIGPEIGVAATKSFVSQVSILALLTLFFGRKRGLSLVMGQRIAKELQKLPNLIETILKQNAKIKKLAQKYKKYDNFFYLGRKYNFPIAHEGALKLKEISYVHAEGYAAGELKHGPIALIDKDFPTIAIAPSDSVYEKMISNIYEIKARGGKIIAVATIGDKKIKKIADDVIYIPKTLEMLTPILSVVPLQLFAYYFGVFRGLDVDKPRNLAKSVTVE